MRFMKSDRLVSLNNRVSDITEHSHLINGNYIAMVHYSLLCYLRDLSAQEKERWLNSSSQCLIKVCNYETTSHTFQKKFDSNGNMIMTYEVPYITDRKVDKLIFCDGAYMNVPNRFIRDAYFYPYDKSIDIENSLIDDFNPKDSQDVNAYKERNKDSMPLSSIKSNMETFKDYNMFFKTPILLLDILGADKWFFKPPRYRDKLDVDKIKWLQDMLMAKRDKFINDNVAEESIDNVIAYSNDTQDSKYPSISKEKLTEERQKSKYKIKDKKKVKYTKSIIPQQDTDKEKLYNEIGAVLIQAKGQKWYDEIYRKLQGK